MQNIGIKLMTKLLCHEDSYIKSFCSKIININNKGLVLDETAFYPGGGGQPFDTGEIKYKSEIFEVKKISKINGEITHEIQNFKPEKVQIGEIITGELDWNRRYQLMRTHTALHIMCGIVWRDYNAHVTGGDMKPLKARMDFELEKMSSTFAHEIEEKVNLEIQSKKNITIDFIHREEALKIPDLIRTKINLIPESINIIRTVNIESLDLQADGGTHVNNTKEVGAIRVTGHESKGKINKRIRIEILNI
tara:strand:- start:26789 stop:27535 length:747 start_codon:yes stop_codon:yes gene_type:complete